MAKVKGIVCLCLPVYNIDKATNTMEDKLCVLMYAVRKSCHNFPKVLIITQVTTSLALGNSKGWGNPRGTRGRVRAAPGTGQDSATS